MLHAEPAAEREVLDGAEHVDQTEVLVDEADAGSLGVVGVAEAQLAIARRLVEDRARGAGGLVVPGEDLDEGRLPRSVLAHERVGLSLADGEMDVVERGLSRELLRQVLDGEQRLHRQLSPSSAMFVHTPHVHELTDVGYYIN